MTSNFARCSDAVLWLEAREGAGPHALWTIEQLASAAYDFGALAAQWQSKLPDVRHFPWLAQRWLRGWVGLVRIFAVDHFLDHDGCGNGSAVEPFLNGSTRRRIAELISDADDLLAGFDSLPVTLAHHDPQWGNLFAAAPDESPARTVAIDWGFFGLAPIGSDLGLHIGQNIMSWGIDQRRAAEHDQASTAAYVSGLQDYGWNGDVDSVRFARATAAALNAGTWLAMEVSWLCPDMAEVFAQRAWTGIPQRVLEDLELPRGGRTCRPCAGPAGWAGSPPRRARRPWSVPWSGSHRTIRCFRHRSHGSDRVRASRPAASGSRGRWRGLRRITFGKAV